MLPNLIVPTLTRTDLLQKLMDSLDYPIDHLLIIDNGGGFRNEEPATLNIPDVVGHVTYLPMPANLGVAGSWNLGVKSFPFADRWFICSDDVEFTPGALEMWCNVSGRDALTISNEWPFFQFFAVGEQVVERVGLFDENLFPANFEDDDYRWRCEAAGIPVLAFDIPHSHVKQGTVFDGNFPRENSRTYPANEKRFKDKQANSELIAGEWSLSIRRANEWRVE